MNKKYIVLSLVLIFILSACKKYEEGPDFSLRTKTERVANTWKIVDIMLGNSYTNYNSIFTSIQYTRNGNYNLVITDINNSDILLKEVNGKWGFYDDKKYIIQSYPEFIYHGVRYLENIDTVKIIMLKEKELWYESEYRGDIYTYKLNPLESDL